MARFLLPCGWAAGMMGAAAILPVAVAALDTGGLTNLGIGIVSVAGSLIACGMSAVLLGFRTQPADGKPSGVRLAIAANILFLAFFALELSDRLVRRDGNTTYWSTFLFLPAMMQFCGLLAAHRWAWWTSRGVSALGVLWFLGFVVLLPFASLHTEGVPVPWYGRVYMACISLAFAGILGAAFWSLGRTETRHYFGLIRTEGTKVAT